MWKTVLAMFIIAHGLVHSGLAAAPNPDDSSSKPGAIFTDAARSWLLPQLGLNASAIKWIGIGLVALSTIGFILTGLGIFGLAGLNAVWRTVAVISSCLSLLLLILFWHRWFPVGVLIDIVVLIALLGLKWPSVEMIGT